ncbi:MAG: Rrf2 family transcriptional regulator [Lachnospiraceae bacterium]|nr:Rrf2 family transcriptional regulator [Lachnospiraceae bacterium]MEE1342604.1 Rrf2 family transcriptional regulator [Lachnospiraceae bacterium]
MKISTKGQYALRMMLDLACNNTGEYIALKSIAARQELPEKYLEQITTVLSKAGYLSSVRGSKGGYRLANPPAAYTVGMILRTIEGDLSPISGMEEVDRNSLAGNEAVVFGVWEELDKAINKVVDGITLEDLVEKYQYDLGNDYVI